MFTNRSLTDYNCTGYTESVSVGGETLSMAGELISGMSDILSDEDIS